MCGDLTYNPGMCPEWDSNPPPFGSQAGTQSTEPHQPGLADTILHRERGPLWILVSQGSRNQSPMDPEAPFKFWGNQKTRGSSAGAGGGWNP